MTKAKLFDYSLFLIAILFAVYSGHLIIDWETFLIALTLYVIFSVLYFNLRIFIKKEHANIDYGISYDLSFVLFAGPVGLIIYQAIFRFIVYANKKYTKTADPDEFGDMIYNIGAFTSNYAISFYLYIWLSPYFQEIPFGFWLLICLLFIFNSYFSGVLLSISLLLFGAYENWKDAFKHIHADRGVPDLTKIAITNSLLYFFLIEGQWGGVIGVFILNYVVNLSFFSKSQSIQAKMERDKYEQMAYTDFLTTLSNRASMDKTIRELNESDEWLSVVVADIDQFKRINDSYNHEVGDKVIQHFATLLKQSLSPHDYVFRSGGEEFTMFLRSQTYERTVFVVGEIIDQIRNSEVSVPFNGEKISVTYTASFGLFYFENNAPISLERGYVVADQLLLQAKENGRNQVISKIHA